MNKDIRVRLSISPETHELIKQQEGHSYTIQLQNLLNKLALSGKGVENVDTERNSTSSS